MSVPAAPTPIICPCCQCENPHDAVFCGNAECHKALGEFRYVVEELGRRAVAATPGKPDVISTIGPPRTSSLRS
jgi:hypothetical protein